jgi:molybdopterin synthase sulfur carrier subunit
MKVLFFGRLADKAGREIDVEIPETGCTVAELRARLCREMPGLAADLSAPSIKACVDQQVAGEDAPVRPGDEVAFIPPLSGG